MKSVTIRLPKDVVSQMAKTHLQPTTLIQRWCLAHKPLRDLSIRRLKGYFTVDELYAILDALKEPILAENMANSAVIISRLESFESIMKFSATWGIVFDILKAKILSLHPCDLYTLIDETNRFWNLKGVGYGEERKFYKKFIADLS